MMIYFQTLANALAVLAPMTGYGEAAQPVSAVALTTPSTLAEPAPPATKASGLPDIRIYVLWGQSHMFGGAAQTRLSDITEPNPPAWAVYSGVGAYPTVPGCFIFDKIARGRAENQFFNTVYPEYPSFKNADLTDQTPGYTIACANCTPVRHTGDTHELRELSAGYAGAETFSICTFGSPAPFGPFCQADDFYPWVPNNQIPDPRFGPEMELARGMQERTGDEIVIVKMAVGGSSVIQRPAGAPSWSPTQLGSQAYLDILEQTYWVQALDRVRKRARANGQDIYLGGVISMIGSSDVRAPYFTQHGPAYKAAIGHLRDFLVGPTNADDLPYLIMQTPTLLSYAHPDDERQMDYLRASQMQISQQMTGVDYADPDWITRISPLSNHFDADGNLSLGRLMAAWARTVENNAIQL